MTSNDEWMRERARQIGVSTLGDNGFGVNLGARILAFAQAAIERGKAEQEADFYKVCENANRLNDELNAANAKLAEQDKAVAAERARVIAARGEEYGHIIAGVGYDNGRQSILARLENPDEALVDAVVKTIAGAGLLKTLRMRDVYPYVAPVSRALARALASQENKS